MFKNCWMNSGFESTLGDLIRSSAWVLANSCACCGFSGGAPLIERRCWSGGGGGWCCNGETCCCCSRVGDMGACIGGVGNGLAGVAPMRVSSRVSFEAAALGDAWDLLGDPRWCMRGEITLFCGGGMLLWWGLLIFDPCNKTKSGLVDDPFTVTGCWVMGGDCCCCTIGAGGDGKTCCGLFAGECMFNCAGCAGTGGWGWFGWAPFNKFSRVAAELVGGACCFTTGSFTGLPRSWFNSANDWFDTGISFWAGAGCFIALLNKSSSDKACGWGAACCNGICEASCVFCGRFAAWNNAARSTDLPTGGELTGCCSWIVAFPNNWSSERLVPEVVWVVVFCTVVDPEPNSVATSILVLVGVAIGWAFFEASLMLVMDMAIVSLCCKNWSTWIHSRYHLITYPFTISGFIQPKTAYILWSDTIVRAGAWPMYKHQPERTRWCLVYNILILQLYHQIVRQK